VKPVAARAGAQRSVWPAWLRRGSDVALEGCPLLRRTCSSPPLVPEAGDTSTHAPTATISPIATPPTQFATSWSSMRSSPDVCHCVPCLLLCATVPLASPPTGCR
jgi:hypothetical protein